MSLDKEAFAMRTTISQCIRPEAMSGRNRRGPSAGAGEDSPYSSYLRSWIAHQAAQHRALLRNIKAAQRIGLAPVILPH
jgi:hypothetical protein